MTKQEKMQLVKELTLAGLSNKLIISSFEERRESMSEKTIQNYRKELGFEFARGVNVITIKELDTSDGGSSFSYNGEDVNSNTSIISGDENIILQVIAQILKMYH